MQASLAKGRTIIKLSSRVDARFSRTVDTLILASVTSNVGKYDRADNRPKLAMLAANVGYRYWADDRSRLGCELRAYIGLLY